MDRSDYTVLLSCEACVSPGWLTRLVEHMEREPSLAMLAPAAAGAPARANNGHLRAADHLRGTCLAVRRSALDQIGLLDLGDGADYVQALGTALQQHGHWLAYADDVPAGEGT
jgi:hypothetical protein